MTNSESLVLSILMAIAMAFFVYAFIVSTDTIKEQKKCVAAFEQCQKSALQDSADFSSYKKALAFCVAKKNACLKKAD